MSPSSTTPSSASFDDSRRVMSKNEAYVLKTHLKGHKGLVLCMSITEDGKLASGGVDGVRIWDFRDVMGKQLPSDWRASQLSRPSGAGDRGPTTALTWVRREDEPDDGLIYGTAGGLVVCWREIVGTNHQTAYEESFCARMANPAEITALAFDSGANRLAISNRNSVISLFRIGAKFDLHPVFSITIKNHIPKALAFTQAGDDKDIYTFGLYDGIIYTLNGKDGKVEDTHYTGCQIGNVCANLRRGVFCIDDPSQGTALYRCNSWDRVRTYPVAIERSMRPRQVGFLEDCKFILSGSDHGVVYLFNRRSGSMVDELKSGKGRVQALTATEHVERPLIFSALFLGASDDDCSIAVWQRTSEAAEKKPIKVPDTQPQGSTWITALSVVFQVSFLIMAVGFMWHNTWVFDWHFTV
ncbi:WD40 repeat-like protein [Agrocybe pediades]|nr:WD40 repeat-like protein [Agrocybe pediades]